MLDLNIISKSVAIPLLWMWIKLEFLNQLINIINCPLISKKKLVFFILKGINILCFIRILGEIIKGIIHPRVNFP